MFFSVQLLLAKVLKSNEMKEAYKIQAQGLQERMTFFSVQLLAKKNSLDYCATQS